MSKNNDQVHVRFVLHAVLDANGEDHKYLADSMGKRFGHAVGNGAVTGETAAEVFELDTMSLALSPQAMALDDEKIAAWLSQQIEDGHIPLERLPTVMARYALADPGLMREEIAERMCQQAEEAAESATHPTPARLT